MNRTGLRGAALLAGAVCVAGSVVGADARAAPLAFSDFTIFLDPPTGFVFVKLPQGWQFVGRVQRTTGGGLPAHVRTALLPAEPVQPGRVGDVLGRGPAADRP